MHELHTCVSARSQKGCFAMFGSAMGLPKTPRTVSVGNCHLAVFLLGFAAAIWHSEALQPVSIGLRNCYPARFQQPFKPLKPPSSFAMGLPRLHELFLLETAIWQSFCWLRSCYLAFATRYNLFLLGFETAIRHVSSSP